jgi:4,5-dihydroxyphthalate decarboxylase
MKVEVDQSRRRFLRAGAYAFASSTLAAHGLSGIAAAAGPDESAAGAIELEVSGYPHEHIRGLATGKVRVKGCEISFQPGKIGDINTHVFSGPRTLGFTEIGLSPYIVAYADGGFRAYSLIPVFPLRLFRHKSIFVHADGGIEHPGQLKGKRVGTPGYSSTSLTWIRGIVQDEYGVRPEDIDWVVSAADSSAGMSGAISKQEQVLPEGLSITVGPPGKDESDLLLDGDVDALFHAAEPRAFVEGNPKIRRLFTDPRKTEQDYFAKTGIFPIMHAVAIRNDLVDKYPWLPKAVFEAYCEAKSLTYADMRAKWYLRALPWFAQELAATQSLMGRNFFPYGIEPNRKALGTLFRYMHEQGLASRQVSVEEMFEPSTLDLMDL